MNMDFIGQDSSGYCLSLSDGSNWWLTADLDSAQWVDELAEIMELEKCAQNGFPKIAFLKMAEETHRHWLSRDSGWSFTNDKLVRIWRHSTIPDAICELDDEDSHELKYIKMWNSLQPIYSQSIARGGLPFHAGLAEIDGRGIFIAATGDTGKSTCCRRLPDYWKALCDDEALAVFSGEGTYRIHPFPTWSDYIWERAKNSWGVQYSVPLSGAFFLEQSDTDEVVPLGSGEASVLISESAIQVCRKFWRRASEEEQRKFRREIFGNACEMAKHIPAFRLRATLHGSFWEQIENVII